MTAQIHVEVVGVRPLEVGQQAHVLLHDLVVLVLAREVDLLDGGLEVPDVNEAVQGALGRHRPVRGHGKAVYNRILSLITFRLWHEEVNHDRPKKQSLQKICVIKI